MKRMKLLVVVALALVICLPGMASADITLFDGLGFYWSMPQNGDPSLAPYTGGVPSPFTITSFDTYFSDTVAFSSNAVGTDAATIAYGGSFAANSWTGTYVSANVSHASGNAISSGLQWNYNFQGSSLTAPVTFDINYFNAATFVGHEHYTLTGFGDSHYTGGFDKTAAVPLPPSVLLLGSGILGLVGLGWRRRKAS